MRTGNSSNGDGALLVVDDDPRQLRIACALLEREGYTVHPAAGAAEGLRLLEEHDSIAGVITDLHMPEIDGWRFCRLLRSPEYRALNDVPLLVLSPTFPRADGPWLTKELGANTFLSVPYQPAALLRHVRQMLAGKHPPSQPGVLLVQEDAPPSTQLAVTFAAHGYDVSVARTIAEGRRLLREHAPRAVVLDDQLEDGAATELLGEIQRPGADCVVIVTATVPQADLPLTLARKGVDAYVRELYDPDYVLHLCERARRHRGLRRVEHLIEERTLQLKQTERRMRAVLRALPELVLICESKGKILEANAAATAALAAEGRSLPGHDLSNIVDSESRDDVAEQLRATRPEASRSFETRFLGAGGDVLEVAVTASAIRFEDREAVLVVARDIGAQRRADEERALLTAAVQQAGEAIVVTGADSKIRYINPAFERITGYSREDAIGASIDILKGDGEDAAVWEQMRKKIAGGASWRGRMQRRRKGGQQYLSEGTVSPVRDESGKIVNYVGVEQDVSQEEELENALRQAQKMEAIGTLAGGVAHDFNNLLTGILGYANLIHRLSPEGSELEQMSEIIERSAERASHLTKELLGFARRGKHRNVPIDMNELVEQVARLLTRTIGKNIKLVTRLGAPSPTVLGDPSQIEQAILNLSLNARDALKGTAEGKIEVGTDLFEIDPSYCALHPGTEPGPYVQVTVTDNGCGMPGDVQARIFEPFFTTKKRGEGTGMGLSMVYGIVKNHGGSIRVYSEPGKGTAFRVFLPLDSKPAEVEAPRGLDEPVRGSGRVLVVDDEEVVRHTAATMLRHLGYDVVALADGEEAVLYYNHFSANIDLVLLDMVMPNMGGHECLLALKKIDPEVRVVLSTGFGLNDAAQAILDDGALGFAQKPYRVAELSQVVATVMRGERYDTPRPQAVPAE